MGKPDKLAKPDIVASSKEYFSEAVDEAIAERKISTTTYVRSYIIDLLDFYLHAENLFTECDPGMESKKSNDTLAELYLKAIGSQPSVKKGMFKRLGDSSLYISGFFGDSLKRKVVDVDYYAEIGGSAYGQLASLLGNDSLAEVYHDFSVRFLQYVDVLTCISQKSFFVNQDDLLRLYDRYILTGSKQAEDQLLDRGLLFPTPYAKKVVRQ